jgi:hypothetical protein
MVVIRTDVGDTIESARRIRFEQVTPITATNVQDAISEANAIPTPVSATNVDTAMSPYVVQAGDTILLVDSTAGPVTINLPPSIARDGQEVTVKDAAGAAATNPISIVPDGVEEIDGLAPYVLDSNFTGVKLGPTTGGYFVDA